MSRSAPADIEIPAQNPATPAHLLVMLHGAGSRPSALAAMAVAWQRRLRSARAWLPSARLLLPDGSGHWTDPARFPVDPAELRAAADAFASRLAAVRSRHDVPAERTVLVGLSQGASLLLELAFQTPSPAGLFIGYGARLYRLPVAGDCSDARIHLIHGGLDSVVPVVYAQTALRRLRAIGARASLELLPDEGHNVGPVQSNAGTQALMDWRFGRGPFASPG